MIKLRIKNVSDKIIFAFGLALNPGCVVYFSEEELTEYYFMFGKQVFDTDARYLKFRRALGQIEALEIYEIRINWRCEGF